jgi:hypothetical protein
VSEAYRQGGQSVGVSMRTARKWVEDWDTRGDGSFSDSQQVLSLTHSFQSGPYVWTVLQAHTLDQEWQLSLSWTKTSFCHNLGHYTLQCLTRSSSFSAGKTCKSWMVTAARPFAKASSRLDWGELSKEWQPAGKGIHSCSIPWLLQHWSSEKCPGLISFNCLPIYFSVGHAGWAWPALLGPCLHGTQ